MRALISGLLVVCLGLVLPSTDADAAGDGVGRITFRVDCADVSGRMMIRQTRVDSDRTDVSLRATGLPLTGRPWAGDISMQPGATAITDTFEVRAPEGRIRHSSRWDVPIASTLVRASVMDIGVKGQPECDVAGWRTRTLAEVASGSSEVRSYIDDGLDVIYSNHHCRNGSASHGRMVVTWRDRTVRKPLHEHTCRDRIVGLYRTIRGRHQPRALAVVVHDDAGHRWRASYRVE